jgi:hypothetical protein
MSCSSFTPVTKGILGRPGGQVQSPGWEFKLGSLSQDQFTSGAGYPALPEFWDSQSHRKVVPAKMLVTCTLLPKSINYNNGLYLNLKGLLRLLAKGMTTPLLKAERNRARRATTLLNVAVLALKFIKAQDQLPYDLPWWNWWVKMRGLMFWWFRWK